MVKLLTGRLLVTLDEGKENIGTVVRHNYLGNTEMMVPRVVPEVMPGEEPPPTPESAYYDHIVFVKEMSDEVEIEGVTYIGMSLDAVIAVIPD